MPTLISKSWQNEQLLSTIRVHEDSGVNTLVISPDGQTIVTCSENNQDSKVKAWNRSTGELLYTLDLDLGWHSACAIAISPDGETLATTCRSRENWKVELWDLKTGRLKATLSDDEEEISDLIFGANGQTLVSRSSRDGTIKIWTIKDRGLTTGELRYSLPEKGIRSIAISPDGQTLVTAANQEEEGLKIWDLQTGELKRTLPPQPFGDFSITPDG